MGEKDLLFIAWVEEYLEGHNEQDARGHLQDQAKAMNRIFRPNTLLSVTMKAIAAENHRVHLRSYVSEEIVRAMRWYHACMSITFHIRIFHHPKWEDPPGDGSKYCYYCGGYNYLDMSDEAIDLCLPRDNFTKHYYTTLKKYSYTVCSDIMLLIDDPMSDGCDGWCFQKE